jgi:hypothetical protein
VNVLFYVHDIFQDYLAAGEAATQFIELLNVWV